MKLKMISPGCSGGQCPTLYQSEDGKYFVQGYEVNSALLEENKIPKGELLVEISSELIESIRNS
ncbi:hypothetical protein DXT91_16530 [Agrobacterium tumefaciens]|uniref:hypothetical protein n=1 Tax=Agrobacterium tumefaciens TaxID=358 RepID=UPI0012B854D4|nr:hypothetical protein [Agrobacterium tumefaciens]MQB05723.1 hypothetical protein [Agrobacterium tumefaciens]